MRDLIELLRVLALVYVAIIVVVAVAAYTVRGVDTWLLRRYEARHWDDV